MEKYRSSYSEPRNPKSKKAKSKRELPAAMLKHSASFEKIKGVPGGAGMPKHKEADQTWPNFGFPIDVIAHFDVVGELDKL